MKIAIIGDFHIPSRAEKIPETIYKKLKKEEPDQILCTGDIGSSKTKSKLKEIAETKIVKGNTDRESFPEEIQQEIQGNNILLIHGSQAVPRGNKDQLKYIAQEKGAEILVSGHTHTLNTDMEEDILLINPGSATGAWSGGGASPKPSFIICQVEGNEIKIKKIKEESEEEETYELN